MGEDTAASLPDLQPLADGLEELAQGDWIEQLSKLDEQLASVVSAEHALSALKERSTELVRAIEDLRAERNAAAQALQTLGHDLAAESANWQSSVKDAGAGVQEACGALKGKLADVTRQGKEHVERLRSTVAERLHAAHLGRVKDSGTALAESVRDARAKVDVLSGDLVSKAQRELGQLEQRLKEDLASKIEQQAAQRFASEAERLGGEVANNLVLSQASVAITGAVTPIMPQLVALKAAVGVIKLALHPFG